MSNYIVTGGAGFIGHHLVNKLIDAGNKVCVLDDFSRGTFSRVNPKAEMWRHDITKTFPEDVVSKYKDGIFHLAALARVPFSLEFPLESNNANTTGTLSVLENARKAGIKNIVFSSSSSVYGDGMKYRKQLSEEDELNPISPYALQKLMGEQYCNLYSQIYGMKTLALRYFNVYGSGSKMSDAYTPIITLFLDQCKNNKPLTITGDGEQTRDFTHVDDVVEANIKSMERITGLQDPTFDVLNIGAGNNHSINELAHLFNGSKISYIEERLEPKNTLANNCKAKEVINWSPKRNFKESVLELIQQEIGEKGHEKN